VVEKGGGGGGEEGGPQEQKGGGRTKWGARKKKEIKTYLKRQEGHETRGKTPEGKKKRRGEK